MSQTPSVGRIVHYVSRGSADGVYQPECRAAVVAEVDTYQESDVAQHLGHVTLCVLNPSGMFFNRAVQDEDDKRGGSWHWPERV